MGIANGIAKDLDIFGEEAAEAIANLGLVKSQHKHEKCYKYVNEWRTQNSNEADALFN